jgi:hypothetical protein
VKERGRDIFTGLPVWQLTPHAEHLRKKQCEMIWSDLPSVFRREGERKGYFYGITSVAAYTTCRASEKEAV